jgi:hypothetical protein
VKIPRSYGSLRYIEVKGRSEEIAVELTANEYLQAVNHRNLY